MDVGDVVSVRFFRPVGVYVLYFGGLVCGVDAVVARSLAPIFESGSSKTCLVFVRFCFLFQGRLSIFERKDFSEKAEVLLDKLWRLPLFPFPLPVEQLPQENASFAPGKLPQGGGLLELPQDSDLPQENAYHVELPCWRVKCIPTAHGCVASV